MNRKREIFEIDYHYCPTCKTELNFKKIDNNLLLACSKCDFVFWNNPKPVVSGILKKNRKVLMIKRAQDSYKNYWSLPGGVINYMETPELAIKREFFEETNIKIQTLQLFHAYLIVYTPRGKFKKPSHTSIDLVYSAEAINNEKINPKPNSKEATDIKFFSPSQLPQKIAFGHRDIINKYFKRI